MLKTILTLVRGATFRAEEEFADRSALLILDQQIRDSAAGIERAKRSLALAIAQDEAEGKRLETTLSRIPAPHARAAPAASGRPDAVAPGAPEADAPPARPRQPCSSAGHKNPAPPRPPPEPTSTQPRQRKDPVMNPQTAQSSPHSGAWITFTYASCAGAGGMVGIGILFAPGEIWV